MIQVFVLTMVLSTSNGGASIATHEYPREADCWNASSEYLVNAKRLASITHVRAWCTVKNKDKND